MLNTSTCQDFSEFKIFTTTVVVREKQQYIMAFGLPKTKGASVADTNSSSSKSIEELGPWTSPILLGGLVPSLFCLVIVVLGQFILLAEDPCTFEVQGQEKGGEKFMRGAVIVSYLFLFVFTWVFMGTTVQLKLPFKTLTLMKPFSKLNTVGVLYSLIGIISIPIFMVGTIWASAAQVCTETSPILYSFSILISVVYWIMFITIVAYLVKIKLILKRGGGGGGAKYSAGGDGGGAASSQHEKGSEGWFREKFENVSGDSKVIESADVGTLLSQCELTVGEDALSKLLDDLDGRGSGDIGFLDLWGYYQKNSKPKKDD